MSSTPTKMENEGSAKVDLTTALPEAFPEVKLTTPAPPEAASSFDPTTDLSVGSSPPNEIVEHALKSLKPGESAIEETAERVETRRKNRIPITFRTRTDFLGQCRGLARIKNYSTRKNKIHKKDVETLQVSTQARIDGRSESSAIFRKLTTFLGFRDNEVTLVNVFDRALERMNEIDSQWLYFQDFSFYDTRLEATYPWCRYKPLKLILIVVSFYLFTPILFCSILKDDQVCPDDPNGNRDYYGWFTAVYFASATMSTVGYGDINVSKDENWKIFVGVVYMVIAIMVGMTTLATAAEQAYSWTQTPLSKKAGEIVSKWSSASKENQFLHQKMRKVRFIKIGEIVLVLTFVNIMGTIVARLFERTIDDNEDMEWSWMITFYWAVQTTTTIGYGDLSMPDEMRWFQTIYLAVSTAVVGLAFGRLASLKAEIKDMKKQYVWASQEMNKRILEDMQGYDHDNNVDQYEFLVGSLLTQGKITSSDVAPIMDKFRLLAGKKGYIRFDKEDEISLEATVEDEPLHGDKGGDDSLETDKILDKVDQSNANHVEAKKNAVTKKEIISEKDDLNAFDPGSWGNLLA